MIAVPRATLCTCVRTGKCGRTSSAVMRTGVAPTHATRRPATRTYASWVLAGCPAIRISSIKRFRRCVASRFLGKGPPRGEGWRSRRGGDI